MTVQTADAERIGVARYRAAMYRNLSAFFNDAPTAQDLDALIKVAVNAVNDDKDACESEQEFYGHLVTLAGCDLEDVRREVASEFAELFIGPRPPLAPYYESIYVGHPRRLFTDQTMKVQQFYEECGFEVIKSGRVPGDNLAYELEFMALLADQEADLLESAEYLSAQKAHERQKLFLAEHLGVWIGLLAARIEEAPCAVFYSKAARFTEGFIEEDKHYLTDMETRPA